MKEMIQRVSEISELMKSFSNKDKLAILCFLWKEEKNVSEIMTCTDISQSQISQYLWKMKLEWILDCEKKWKEVFYKISEPKVLELISAMKSIFNS